MKPRQILIYLVLFILAAGFYWLYEVVFKDREADLEKSQALIFDLDQEKVTALRLKTESGEIHLERQGKKDWRLIQPVETPAVDYKVDMIISKALSGKKGGAFKGSSDDLAQFGLDKPSVALTLMSGGKILGPTLYLGGKKPLGLAYYARLGNEKEIFSVPDDFRKTLNKTAFDLRNKDLLMFDQDKIDGLRVHGAEEIELKKTGVRQWEVLKPGSSPADPNKVESIIFDGLKKEVKAFPTEPVNSPEFGFDEPKLVIEVLSQGKVVADIAVGRTKAKEPADRKAGEPETEGYYVRSSERSGAVLIDREAFTALNKTLDDVIDKHILSFEEDQVTAVEISAQGKTFKAERTDDGWKTVEPEEARDKDFNMLHLVYYLENLEYLKSLEIKERALGWYGLDRTVIGLKLAGPDKTVAELKLAARPYKENLVAVGVESGSQGAAERYYLIDANILTKLPPDIIPTSGN